MEEVENEEEEEEEKSSEALLAVHRRDSMDSVTSDTCSEKSIQLRPKQRPNIIRNKKVLFFKKKCKDILI